MTAMAEKLRQAYEAAEDGNKVVTIHLFGIEHANELRGRNMKDLAIGAGISGNYGPELNKAIRLADYVTIVRRP